METAQPLTPTVTFSLIKSMGQIMMDATLEVKGTGKITTPLYISQLP